MSSVECDTNMGKDLDHKSFAQVSGLKMYFFAKLFVEPSLQIPHISAWTQSPPPPPSSCNIQAKG